MDRRNYFQADRNIPENAARFREIEHQALLALYQERFGEAVELYEEAYNLLFELQFQLMRGIHKGTVLYNLGIAILGRRQRDASRQALRHILLAYIEDTLGAPFDNEEDADRAPAGRFLIDGFVVQLRFLREM